MGHFSDTLMAVCSTPSSPLRVVLPAEAATLLKFLLTKKTKQKKTKCFRGRGLLCVHLLVHFKTYFKANHTEKQVYVCVIKMYLCILTTLKRQKKRAVLLVMQCSAGRSLFFRSPWRTERTDGLWTSCSTNRWDCRATREHKRQTVYLAERIH